MSFRRSGRVVPGVGAAGLLVIVAGTFLPWLCSGQARRNCYQASGSLRRLGFVHGVEAAGLAALPWLGLACGAAAAAWLLGTRRIGATLAAAVAVCAGTASIGTLRAQGSGLVRPAVLGPAVTVTGAALVLLAALVAATVSGTTAEPQ
jgi:hypothetical protein